jgi:hypothetical protein
MSSGEQRKAAEIPPAWVSRSRARPLVVAALGSHGYLQHPVEQIRAVRPIRSGKRNFNVLITLEINHPRDWHVRCNILG